MSDIQKDKVQEQEAPQIIKIRMTWKHAKIMRETVSQKIGRKLYP